MVFEGKVQHSEYKIISLLLNDNELLRKENNKFDVIGVSV